MNDLRLRALAKLEHRRRKKGDPVVWAQEQLGVQLWSKQEDILRSVFSNEHTVVRAAAKVGKTFTCACAVLAFLSLKADADVAVPSSLDEDLIKEIRNLSVMKGFKNQIYMTNDGDWEIFNFSPERRAENLLIVVDDVPISPIPNGHLLWISTPVEGFVDCYDSEWTQIHVSAFDSPNFTGEEFAHKDKLISQSWIDAQGWEKDSAVYRSKVLAEIPESSIDMILDSAFGGNGVTL